MSLASQTHDPLSQSRVNRDEEHLRLLALYHRVVAGIHSVALLVFVVLPLIIGPAYYHSAANPLPVNPKLMQQLLLVSLIVRGLIIIMIALNGWFLQQKRHWLTCVILSILECGAIVLLHEPSGLLLGVSAILVLRRESVKALYKAAVGA
jgi:hypothetical protein